MKNVRLPKSIRMNYFELSLGSWPLAIIGHKLVIERQLYGLDFYSRASLPCWPEADIVTQDCSASRWQECRNELRASLEDSTRGPVIYGQLPVIRLECSAQDHRTVRPRYNIRRLAWFQTVIYTESNQYERKAEDISLPASSLTHSLT